MIYYRNTCLVRTCFSFDCARHTHTHHHHRYDKSHCPTGCLSLHSSLIVQSSICGCYFKRGAIYYGMFCPQCDTRVPFCFCSFYFLPSIPHEPQFNLTVRYNLLTASSVSFTYIFSFLLPLGYAQRSRFPYSV